MPVSKTKVSAKKVEAVKAAPKPAAKAVKASGLDVAVYGLNGSKKGTVALSKEIFGVKVNKDLMAQAIRVYLVNQRQGTVSTKTRSEVRASTRKIYRQKGTGRARHGAITAPIFVGGGIAFGPRPRDFELKMSKQMRRKALFSALSLKLSEEAVFVVDASAASGKTKEMFSMFKAMNLLGKNKSKVLYVRGDQQEAKRASKNIGGLNIEPAHNLNTYEVINSNAVVFEKSAIGTLEKVFLKQN